MTLHASKGLEFDTVFIIGVNQGLIPLRCKNFEQEEEDRRLFFVGITRAENDLELSWYTNPGERGVIGEPSPEPVSAHDPGTASGLWEYRKTGEREDRSGHGRSREKE